MKKKTIELKPTVKRPEGTRIDYAEHEDVMDQDIDLVDSLIQLCDPENMENEYFARESEYIELTEAIALNIANWDGPGQYGDYIELSAAAIDSNCDNADSLDLNACVATLICVHREQHFNGYSDVIGPRIKTGKLLRVAKRIGELTL